MGGLRYVVELNEDASLSTSSENRRCVGDAISVGGHMLVVRGHWRIWC